MMIRKTMDLTQPEVRDSYQRLLHHLPGAVYRSEIVGSAAGFSTDYSMRLKFISSGIYRILNISSEHLERDVNTLETMTVPEDLQEVRQAIYQSYVTQRPYQIVYRLLTADGLVRWVWDQGEVVRDDADGPLFIEGLMMDLSEFKTYEQALREENKRLTSSLDKVYGLGNIVGKSDVMQKLYEQIRRAGASMSNVLVRGETGSGKELVAQAVHAFSAAANGPFIPVNCGAIPEQLLESEFFGYRKGAFSGALCDREGFIGAAHNGTLFLDEIGELPLHLQAKLLRALETKSTTPLGGNKPVASSFRLIAATNQDLAQMVREKKMRSDFYYRINVIPIHVPPLRERIGDIPLLLSYYMNQNNIVENVPFKVKIAMEQYTWPGNVRELINFMDRYFTFGDGALEELRDEAFQELPELQENTPLDKALALYEYQLIAQAMEKCRWKQAAAAQMLGVSLRTFQRKLQKFHITR